MVSAPGNGMQGTFSPSNRILELACHKCSKTVYVTTPCEKLTWGNQEPIWPICRSALTALPSRRTQRLARPKRDLTAGGPDYNRREEGSSWRKTPPPCPSSKRSQAELVARLSARRPRLNTSEEPGTLYGHTPDCEPTCPVWHVDLRIRNPKLSPRLLELSRPKTPHPHVQSKRQLGAPNAQVLEKGTPETSRAWTMSPRLEHLSLPRLRLSQVCYPPGPPEEPIRTVSMAARRAKASPRIERLATPKQLSDGYAPPS
ncbi:unnamed protein product [Arctogadus glacialis]